MHRLMKSDRRSRVLGVGRGIVLSLGRCLVEEFVLPLLALRCPPRVETVHVVEPCIVTQPHQILELHVPSAFVDDARPANHERSLLQFDTCPDHEGVVSLSLTRRTNEGVVPLVTMSEIVDLVTVVAPVCEDRHVLKPEVLMVEGTRRSPLHVNWWSRF